MGIADNISEGIATRSDYNSVFKDPRMGAYAPMNKNTRLADIMDAKLVTYQNQPGNGGGGPTNEPLGDPIDGAFNPLLDFFRKQAAQLQDRYKANAADLKNIFGTLTTVRSADIPKIQQQFATSIQQQQNALAGRTAETRAATQATTAGAATAASELGSGQAPTVPATSLAAVAAEKGVADANAYQTVWENLQGVMSAQSQENVRAQVQGYDYQQISALESLQRDLEDKLMQISGNEAQVQSDIAQAKIAAQAAQAGAEADAATLQAKLANDIAVQQLKNQGSTNVALIRNAGGGSGGSSSTTDKKVTYPASIQGWEQKIRDNGGDAGTISSIKLNTQNLVDKLIAQMKKEWIDADNPASTFKTPKIDTAFKQKIWKMWQDNPNYGKNPDKAMAADYVQEYIQKYLGW